MRWAGADARGLAAVTPLRPPAEANPAAVAGRWQVKRLQFPSPDRADDHLHLICIGEQGAVCSIAQPGERSDAEADAIANLLGAARDLRTALAATRRELERADGVPCRPWLLSLINRALARAGGGSQ
jgi:hypothetical protein